MELSIAVSASASSIGAPSFFSSPGVGPAGIFVTAILIYLLAYLNIVKGSEHDRPYVQSLLVTASIPLFLAFSGIFAYESLSIVGIL